MHSQDTMREKISARSVPTKAFDPVYKEELLQINKKKTHVPAGGKEDSFFHQEEPSGHYTYDKVISNINHGSANSRQNVMSPCT